MELFEYLAHNIDDVSSSTLEKYAKYMFASHGAWKYMWIQCSEASKFVRQFNKYQKTPRIKKYKVGDAIVGMAGSAEVVKERPADKDDLVTVTYNADGQEWSCMYETREYILDRIHREHLNVTCKSSVDWDYIKNFFDI